MIVGSLLLLLAAVHLGIEYAPALWGGTPAAWHYVGYGIESLGLWLLVARLAPQNEWRWPLWLLSAYGVWESMQRAGCRLLLPMDRAPKIENGQTLCDAAGVPGWQLTPAVLALVAAVIAQRNYKV